MFARTERLTLRPAWPEDAPALAAAIGHEDVARMLLHVTHPYTMADAVAWTSAPRAPEEPCLMIEAHGPGPPALVGGIAVTQEEDGPQFGDGGRPRDDRYRKPRPALARPRIKLVRRQSGLGQGAAQARLPRNRFEAVLLTRPRLRGRSGRDVAGPHRVCVASILPGRGGGGRSLTEGVLRER